MPFPRTPLIRASTLAFSVGCMCLLLGAPHARAQEPARPQAASGSDIQAAIDKLGDLDYATRTAAARLLRRAPADQAVPALRKAAGDHADGYVRFRALVLLTGFNDPQTGALVRTLLDSPNDRLRTVAYGFLEQHPDPETVPRLLAALETETSEFVRPALVRALAVLGSDVRVQQPLIREAGRGEDYFRSAVIEALGEYKARYAYDALAAVARLDGPLQDDAALALGRVGDPRAVEVLAGLQRSAPRESQPFTAAAICLLGTNCESHEGFVVESLKFAVANTGFQPLLRSSAAALGALGMAGRERALQTLFEVGAPSREPARAPIALAVGTVALRNAPFMLSWLEKQTDSTAALGLLADGFDMLEEDFDKEQFFARVRRSYWAAAEGSGTRRLMQALITRLDF